MLLGVLDRPPRVGVRVGAAAGPEHRHRAGVLRLHGNLREAGVVAAPAVIVEGRVVAGVAENDGADRPSVVFDAQHGHVGIDGAAGIAADDEALGGRLPAVDGEFRGAVAEGQPRRFAIGQRRQGRLDGPAFQVAGVAFDARGLPGVERVHVRERVGQHRTGLRVR